jgi:uncharacterized protein YlxW (UPF0749 family)
MIHINLVRKERKKDRKDKSLQLAAGDMGQQLIFVGMFLLTFAVMAFFWFDISGKQNELQQEVREAQAEKRRLEKVKKLVDGLEKERNKLAARLEVLSSLKNNLRTPLHPLFFVYLAQQENPRVLLQTVKVDSSGEFVIVTISGLATQENLNSFSETLLKEKIIADVDINSQRGMNFQIRVDFVPFSKFGESAGGQVASPAD